MTTLLAVLPFCTAFATDSIVYSFSQPTIGSNLVHYEQWCIASDRSVQHAKWSHFTLSSLIDFRLPSKASLASWLETIPHQAKPHQNGDDQVTEWLPKLLQIYKFPSSSVPQVWDLTATVKIEQSQKRLKALEPSPPADFTPQPGTIWLVALPVPSEQAETLRKAVPLVTLTRQLASDMPFVIASLDNPFRFHLVPSDAKTPEVFSLELRSSGKTYPVSFEGSIYQLRTFCFQPSSP